MPLSEDEQRILRQIEQELESDPTFTERVSRVPRGRLAMLSVGLVICLLLTVAGLAISFWLAFAGFLAVLVLAVQLEGEVRVIGREKISNLPINAWLAGSGRPRPPR